ncbi:hypothetical protein [Actinoplanes sp. HUAS TT8]|uniref:hypothetical protein n=1 Tax=Actinoplanes sp. HUAS TT8 TaxID=3447453 RepID=UPI003F51B1A2
MIMPTHRRLGGRLPLLVVPAVLLVVAVAAVVVWRVRSDGDGCTYGTDGCVVAPLAERSGPDPASEPLASSAVPSARPGSSFASPARSPGSARPKPPSATPTRGSEGEVNRGPCASAAACGYPHAGNTGPTKTPKTKKSGDISIKENGQVVDGWNLTGSLDVYANNVTVKNCTITSSNWWAINLRPGFTGLKVTHCRIADNPGKGPDNGGSNYAVSNMGDGSVEVGYNEIAGFGNVLSMGHGNIHDNYVHSLSTFVTQSGEWQHTDAVISNGSDSGGLVIRHNTLLNQTPIDKGSTAAVGLYADNGPVRNTTVQDNWMAGGAYVLYGGAKGSSNVKILDNVFSTQFHANGGIYGFATAWDASGSGNVWSGNRTSKGVFVTAPKE